MSLHEKLAAKLDELEAIAERATPHQGQWVYSWQDEEPLGWAVGIAGETATLWLARGLSAEVAEQVVRNGSPNITLRHLAEDRDMLATITNLRKMADNKLASADRMGDPRDPDMSGPDRIAWLLQQDIATGLREIADGLESSLARRHRIEESR